MIKDIIVRKLVFTTILVLGSFAMGFANSFDVYVSTKGKATNSGVKTSPVNSLEKALELLAQQYSELPFDEANIWFEAGVYPQTKTVSIAGTIFGGNAVELSIGKVGKGEVIFTGGVKIENKLFAKVTHSKAASLHKNAIGKVLVANLKGTKAENAFIYLDVDKEWNPMAEQFSYLTWNEHLLQLACWPNRGYSHIDTIIDGGPTNRWLKPGEEPMPFSLEKPTGGVFTTIEQANWKQWDKEFKPSGQVIVEGYLHNDWYFQRERVGKVDNGEIKLLHHIRYGIEHNKNMIERRVRFVNMLCELDQPGEWYFDADTKELYIWPIAKLTSKVNISVIGGDTFIQLENSSHVTIRDITFQNGGKLAIELNGGDNNTIGACTFRNFIDKGLAIKGGKNNGVTGCTFHGLMGAGSVSGGNRKTLEACHNYFTNNEIYNCRNRGYGVIGLSGVGILFAHNLLHDMNGALSYSGSDIIIELNEFYNMGWEMGDWNVAYIGADWASFGNEVRHNFVHHLMEMPGAYPVEAFRNDDLGMGVKFTGNVFYKSGRGCIAFSGAGNDCTNNIALETSTVWQSFMIFNDVKSVREHWEHKRKYDDGELKRGDKDDNLWRAEQLYGKMGWLFDPYKSKYPTLKKIMNDGNPFAPSYGVVKHNYIDKEDPKKGFYMHRCTVDDLPASTDWEYPNSISKDAFTDLSVLDLSFKKDFKPVAGFQPIPFGEIGLEIDEFRTSAPDKNAYRKKIKEQLNGMPSAGGRYNMKEAYKRYPVPEYLK